jgi:hypothetical protein
MSKERATILNNLPKPALFGIMLTSLVGVFLVQSKLNEDRGKLSPSHLEPLQDAPPMLALVTQSIAGFRGIITSYLWIRSNEMQQKKNFPEQMQLAKWITQLQPQVPTAWVNRSWNMAYNISRNYEDPEIRWKYIHDAVKMLRDEGIKYNPQEPLVYDQLAYLFEHKIGHNMDDHHRYYKFRWMQAMEGVLWESPMGGHLAKGVPDFESLINPDENNKELMARVRSLRQDYGMDPREMRSVHRKYGLARDHTGKVIRDKDGKPIGCLDWRMPETQSLYWANLGLKRCSLTPGREKRLHQLEKKVYVSMMYTFQRGRLNVPSGTMDNMGIRLEYHFSKEMNPLSVYSGSFLSSPNLDSGGAVHKAYMDMIKLAQESRTVHYTSGTSEMGHVHFLRRLMEWLYFYNREEEAMEWLKVAIKLYPEKMSYFPGYNSETKTYNLEDIVFNNLDDDIKRGSDSKSQMLMFGVFIKHFFYLADGDEERAKKYFDMAKQIHNHYTEKFKNSPGRMGIPPFEEYRITRLRAFLMEENPLLTGSLRTRLGLGKDELPEVPKVQGPQPQPGPVQ